MTLTPPAAECQRTYRHSWCSHRPAAAAGARRERCSNRQRSNSSGECEQSKGQANGARLSKQRDALAGALVARLLPNRRRTHPPCAGPSPLTRSSRRRCSSAASCAAACWAQTPAGACCQAAPCRARAASAERSDAQPWRLQSCNRPPAAALRRTHSCSSTGAGGVKQQPARVRGWQPQRVKQHAAPPGNPDCGGGGNAECRGAAPPPRCERRPTRLQGLWRGTGAASRLRGGHGLAAGHAAASSSRVGGAHFVRGHRQPASLHSGCAHLRCATKCAALAFAECAVHLCWLRGLQIAPGLQSGLPSARPGLFNAHRDSWTGKKVGRPGARQPGRGKRAQVANPAPFLPPWESGAVLDEQPPFVAIQDIACPL